MPKIVVLGAGIGVPTLAFDDEAADACGAIVASASYSRRKLLGRMIAVQALVHRASLVTMNAGRHSGAGSAGVVTLFVTRR